MQQLEQEVKLDIGTDWSLPDLSGVLPGVRAHPMPDLALETTYFDTADLRLTRLHVAVRFRRETEAVPRSRRRGSGPPPQGSHDRGVDSQAPLDIRWGPPSAGPSSPGLSRRAGPHQRPARPHRRAAGHTPGRPALRAEASRERVHPEAAAFVHAIALGRPLVAVAHLVTTRQRTELRTSDGRRLAEIDHDIVSGKAFATNERRLGADRGEVRFSEVEVELAEGSSLEILEAVVDKLQESGARTTVRREQIGRRSCNCLLTPRLPASVARAP